MPARETTYEYDGDRLVRSTEWVESEWDETQQAWILALVEYEAGLCPVCGGPVDDCQSPDVDGNNPAARWRWKAELPIECHKTSALRAGAKQDPGDTRALIGTVRRVPRGAASLRR